jgi:hypothetical protein
MESAPPFFIGCMARSGSTLLRMMLDSHPLVYIGPESRWHDAPDPPGRIEELRRKSPKRHWGDKPPKAIYREHLACLVSAYGTDFRMISIHRNPADVYASWVQSGKWKTDAKFFRRYKLVLDGTRYARERLAPQLLEVGYEELVRNPEPILRAVVDFIGCDFDERMLHWHEDAHDLKPVASYSERMATQELFTSSVGKHAEVLASRPRVRRRLRKYCDFWGYPAPE